MFRFVLILIVFFASFQLQAQSFKRNIDESAEQFIERIKPKYSGIVHPVIETNWNNSDKKVIIAFWDIQVTSEDKSYTGVYVDAKMFVPLGNNHYKQITIDTIPEDPTTPQILSVFFHDTDYDGKRELVILNSWYINTYFMVGTRYEAAVYDDIDYNKIPSKLTFLERFDGGISGDNELGEEVKVNFTTAQEARVFLTTRGAPNKTDRDFEKSFFGKIGKDMNVVFRLTKIKNSVYGFYYYENRGMDISLSGTIDNGLYEIYEKDFKGERTAKITGRLTDTGFSGKWESLKNKKTYPVQVREIKETVKPLPTTIVGKYCTSNKDDCTIKLSIYKEKDIYKYTFRLDDKVKSGNASFYREYSDNNDAIYVRLDGIKWAENAGDLTMWNNDETEGFPSQGDTYGLDMEWSDNTLIFQNYGNSMNYYVKIAACGSKFVELRKE